MKKQNLTPQEIDELEEGAIFARIALPSVMILFLLLLRWILGIPWPVIWFMVVFILGLSLYSYFTGGKKEMNRDLREGMKLIRSGTITDIDAETAGPYKPVIDKIHITLEKESAPVPYPQHHTFCIYNANSSLYLSMDHSLPKRYKKLQGQSVEVEYFPYSGELIAFREKSH